MRVSSLLIAVFSLFTILKVTAQENSTQIVRKIYDEALVNGKSYSMLEYLCKNIGNRLSGSPRAAAAVEWSRLQMIDLGFDTVYLQPVIVPRWDRGAKEVGRVVGSKAGDLSLNVLSIGNSIGTGSKGVKAEVLEVRSLEELKTLGRKKVENKIVFFNKPMDPKFISTADAYVGAYDIRVAGASEAAKLGALAVIVRSLTLTLDDFPHTGTLRYASDAPQIPAVAISTKGAETLSKLISNDAKVNFYLENYCQMKDSVLSYNVIGELKGSQKVNEIITVGGHLDSWDVGEGAHDDGAGCVQAIEVLRIFKSLGIRPKRTLRAVMFMNEENGLAGGNAYAKFAKNKREIHKLAIESDEGGFTPLGFSIDSKEKLELVKSVKSYFEAYQIHTFIEGFSGADIEPLKDQGALVIGFIPDNQRYFNIHHTENDTFDKVDKRELSLGAAAIASLVYLLDQKDTL